MTVAKRATTRRPAKSSGPTGKRAASARSDRLGGAKLAANVTDWMIQDIAARGWPVGEVLGSETELLERYGVSRAVFREAVRLLEHQQIGRMRRGPGGGLVIEAPTVESVMEAVAIYLFSVRAEIAEVFEARLALEETAAELAPSRLTEHDIDKLRELQRRETAGDVSDLRELHSLVAQVSKNPALEFFVELLNQSTLLYFPDRRKVGSRVKDASSHAHVAIITAVLQGDEGLARRRMRKHLEAEATYLRRKRPTDTQHVEAFARAATSDKRGERVARQIFVEVYSAGWQVGAPLGSEAALMERFDASRAVLREAVRVLEHHQVAVMRRGPGGGLFVAKPGVAATTEAVALHLDRLGIKPHHVREVRTAVEMAILSLVIERLDDQGEVALREALELERMATPAEFVSVGHDLHGVLAGIAGNRVLELLALVLLRLTRIRAEAPADAPSMVPTEEVMGIHQSIVDAILARDLDLARHRMRSHLHALERWTR